MRWNTICLLGVVSVGMACSSAKVVDESACMNGGMCDVQGGSYMAFPPEEWDGTSPLPTTVYFHGYGGSAPQISNQTSTMEGFSQAGELLIIPDGMGNTWAHQGSPSSRRDEIAFMDAVMADVKTRWPVDPARLRASGFSQGGSMAWDLACNRGGEFSAFFPMSGAFWEPIPTSCPAPAINLRHTHGTADNTVPMEGRPIGGSWRQGDVRQGLALWQEKNQCAQEPDRVEQSGQLTCEIWDSCASEKEIRLCLFDGGHVRVSGWVAASLAWADSVAQ